MKGPGPEAREALPGRAAPVRWLGRLSRSLHPYRPPLQDWRFWVVQGLVVVVAGTHSGAELLKLFGHPVFLGSEPRVALASFVTVSLFFVPVVYAALNFGFTGAIATAAWCTVLTVPNLVVFHTGMERLREGLQIGIVDAIAVFVGQRVEQEMSARHQAEAAGAALRASEMKYRGLFESSPFAVLVLDPTGAILDANPAAGTLLGIRAGDLRGASVADMLGEGSQKLLTSTPGRDGGNVQLTLKASAGRELYLEPTITRIVADEGKPLAQVLLRDVTEERLRQAGLKAYAAYVIRAQEEERLRIAQELHDETVQNLILLCRRLDTVEGPQGALPPPVVAGLHEARRSAEQVLQQLRDFAKALRPLTLEDLGLVTSIRRLLLDLAERAKLEGHLKVTGEERRLPPDTELGLFRIAQEALRNVERHAHATNASVTLSFADPAVRLVVRDDGTGFNVSSSLGGFASRGKLGLLGMQERAELLGGRLELHSAPGKGTSVTVSIPL